MKSYNEKPVETKDFYLLFGTPVCAPCKIINKKITEMGLEDNFYYHDCLADMQKAEEYNVTSTPTIIKFFKNAEGQSSIETIYENFECCIGLLNSLKK
jgi:thioredoxin-related protein